MKSITMRRTFVLAAAVMSLGACGQSSISPNSADSSPGAQEVTATQAEWKRLTAAADAALKRSDKAEAERLYKEASEMAQQLGESDPASAEAIANLASFYYVQGDGDQANDLYQRSLKLHEKAVGLEHVDLVKDLVGLARVNSSQKHYRESAGYYERAIAILKEAGQKTPSDIEAEYAAVQKASESK